MSALGGKPVRVIRNPNGRSEQPWFVMCSLCSGHDESDFLGSLFSAPHGWAPTWEIAQQYAQRHAIEHERTRCTTCLHLPAQPLPKGANA